MHPLLTPMETAPGRHSRAPSRELARRQTGSVEVRLLWHAVTNRIEISLHDSATDAGLRIRVSPADALDAFYHPYAYAPRVVQAEEALDG